MLSRTLLSGFAVVLVSGGTLAATGPAAGDADGSTPPVPLNSHAVLAKDYPPVARQLREEGEVTIRYLVEQNGKVSECRILMSSSEPRLDISACLIARRSWTFKPATRDGKPVSEYLEGKVTFQLGGENL